MAAPERCPVDIVVVDQGGGVEEFDASGGSGRPLTIVVKRPGGEEQEERPKALSTRLHDVLDQGGDDREIDGRGPVDTLVHQLEIGRHGFEDV